MRRVLPALVLVSAGWALFVALTGGLEIHAPGFRFTSTSPDRPVYAMALFAALYVSFFRDDARQRAQTFVRVAPLVTALERAAVPIVVILSIGVCLVGIRQGVLVAEASDAYGYVSQADLWLERDLIVEQPFAAGIPWPNADWTFAPLGYRPAPTAGAVVPTYPPGLPVLMAIAKRVAGICGPFLIAPFLGGLTIWLTYLLGARLSTRLVGLAGAALLATSPIFLLMTLSPLSDVPATAFLVLGLVLALSSSPWRAFWTGAAVSVAIFIRPNLVFVGAAFLASIVLTTRPREGRSPGSTRWREVLLFSLGGAPLVLVVAVVNTALYGAPWSAGHGSLGELYSWRFLWQNLIDYPRWMVRSETAFIALSVVPLLAGRRAGEWRESRRFLLTFIGAVWLSYLFYRAYGVWLYLRFLLPIVPVLLVLAAWGLIILVSRVKGAGERTAIALLVVVAVLGLRVGSLRDEQVTGRWREGVPYTSVAKYIEQHLPANAVVLTVQHSGSVRYYADRLTLRWDFLPAEWWPRAANVLTERGYRPYVLLTSAEDEAFRHRFGLTSAPDAPGTLVATFQGSEVNRLYDPLRHDAQTPASIPEVRSHPCGCF